MHSANPVPHEQNINSLLGKDIQFVLREGDGNLSLRVHVGRERLLDNLRFWHGIATGGWLGRLRLWLGVPGSLG